VARRRPAGWPGGVLAAAKSVRSHRLYQLEIMKLRMQIQEMSRIDGTE